MSVMFPMKSVSFVVLLALAFFGSCLAGPVVLSKQDRDTLAKAYLRSAENLAILAAAAPGHNEQTAALVESLGGRVVERFDQVDILAFVLPMAILDNVLASELVVAVDIDARFDIDRPTLADGRRADETTANTTRRKRPEAKLPDFPLDRADSFLDDLNARNWRMANPSFDGRGVIIGLVEKMPDVLLPELQWAKDKNGQPVRKIIDAYINPYTHHGLSPDEDIPEWTLMRLSPPRQVKGGSLSFDHIELDAPGDGEFQHGVLAIPHALLANIGFDTAGHEEYVLHNYTRGSSQYTPAMKFTAVWRSSDRKLWLDTDRDGQFTDEIPASPFAMDGDYILLGEDDPATPHRESMAFVFEISADGKGLAFAPASGGHATTVAGSAASSRGKAGRIEGVAPGAQLIVYQGWAAPQKYARALVAAFADPRTDLVLVEGYSTVTGGLPELQSGNQVFGILLQRLIDIYDKPAFVTAHNDLGMTQIADFCAAPAATCVGAHQSRATTLLTQGIDMGVADSLHWVGSSGPAGNGAIKPDLLAPSNIITLHTPLDRNPPGKLGLYEPAFGYGVGGGTSNAAPVAAGVGALLISAAKQRGLPHGAAAIGRSLLSSARYIDAADIEAYQQGRGVIDVAGAWLALQEQADAPSVTIEVAAPVRTAHSQRLETPHRGVGLFEREGWFAGMRESRVLTLMRTSGPDETMYFDVLMRGDAKSFSAPDTIGLPLNQAVPITIDVSTPTPGAHSALMVLRAPGHVTSTIEIGLTVVAAEKLTSENGFSYKSSIALRPAERSATFVDIPERAGVLAFKQPMVYRNARRKNLAYAIHLSPSNAQTAVYFPLHPSVPAARWDLPDASCAAFWSPPPGVWATLLYDRGINFAFDWNSVYAEKLSLTGTVTLDFALLDVRIEKKAATVNITNRGAAFRGGLASMPGASLREERGSLTTRSFKTFEIDVATGATLLGVELMPLTADRVDVDLRLFHCPQDGQCEGVRRADSHRMEERILVLNPAPGTWKVLVSAYGASGTEAAYLYRDYWAHPDFGMLAAADPVLTRAVGDSWTVPISRLHGNAEPAIGRELVDMAAVEAHPCADPAGGHRGPKWLKRNLDLEQSITAPIGLTLLPRR